MQHSEVAYLDFNREQGQAIALASQTLTELGGGPKLEEWRFKPAYLLNNSKQY